jgi:hypothetical protein
VMSRARRSLPSELELLHTRMRPCWEAPLMSRTVPSGEKEMKFARPASPTIDRSAGAACDLDTTTSPSAISKAALGGARVMSTNTIQPWAQLPVVTHAVPFALLQTVMRLPRRMASLRASASALTKSLLVVVMRLAAINDWKLGTPTASRTPRTAMPTMSSIKVSPR